MSETLKSDAVKSSAPDSVRWFTRNDVGRNAPSVHHISTLTDRPEYQYLSSHLPLLTYPLTRSLGGYSQSRNSVDLEWGGLLSIYKVRLRVLKQRQEQFDLVRPSYDRLIRRHGRSQNHHCPLIRGSFHAHTMSSVPD